MMSSPARPSLPFSLPSLLALCCALGGASALQVGAVAAPRPSARAGAVTMGGFEQKSVPMAAGERVSLQLSGEHGSLSALSEACRTAAKEGALTGIIYDLQRLGRLEVIAEGAREQLEALVKVAESGDGVDVRVAWQPPVGGYNSDFSVVTLKPTMEATLKLKSDKQCLDYYTRHLQVEAVFNRGLKLSSKRSNDELLELTVSGDSGRLKSFVRWAQRGPPLQRADHVEVKWSH